MLFDDTYTELAEGSEAQLREKGSRFFAFAYPVHSEGEIKEHLAALRLKYPDATHHVYAYALGPGGEAQRANDDGEPSGSSGRPVLRAILSAGLTNTLVVVVRYFGGTLLGIPGLIASYGGAAELTLQSAGKKTCLIEVEFSIESDFENEQAIHLLLRPFEFRVLDRQYETGVLYRVAIRRNDSIRFEKAASEAYKLSVKSIPTG